MKEKKNLKVMIVDDDHFIRQTLKILLERDGFGVVAEAVDGVEAIRLSEKHTPDLIFMDYLMDNMDGITATKAIKKLFPDITIIMLTENARPSVVTASMKGGASNFLMKSKMSEQLPKILNKFM